MAQRKPLSKTTRFEVFKRDSFTCQYCGSKAPDVILEIDHINPVSKGGDNEMMNLLTSCFTCNRGKTDRVISDNSVVEKQRKQIEELNIRRQQLEMMLQWRDENIQLKNEEVQKAIDYFNNEFYVYRLSGSGADTITKYVKKYGIIKVLDAIDKAIDKYYVNDDSFDLVLKKVGGILNIESMPEFRQKISYIINTAKHRMHYINNYKLISLLTEYHNSGYDLDPILEMVKNYKFKNYTEFVQYLNNYVNFNE